MICIEVTNEADVTRMVAVFQIYAALEHSDYEIWLTSEPGPGGGAAMRRAWRTDGVRGAVRPADWPGIEPDEPARDLNR